MRQTGRKSPEGSDKADIAADPAEQGADSPSPTRRGHNSRAVLDGAVYVADMLAELGTIARDSGNGFLYYLIDMARIEADNCVAAGLEADSGGSGAKKDKGK